MNTPTIGIDARMYGLEHAGIGRYTMNLVQQLARLDLPASYTLFLTKKYYDELVLPENITKVCADIRHYSFAEQTQFLKLLYAHPVDLMHFPHFNVPLLFNRPFVVTIHDILWHQVKGLSVTTLNPVIYLLKYLGYRAVVRHAATAARTVITPSVWVKHQLLDHYRDIPEEKIAVTHEAADAVFTKTTASATKPALLPNSDYVLYTGSAYPHKNVRLLIEAIGLLHHQGNPVKLVIAGSRSVFVDELRAFVKRLELTDTVVFTGYLTDSQLRYAYEHAQMLVHPSFSEGFGLTGLEAMAAGTPVLAAAAGSLPEIYADAAAYFNPKSVTDLSHAIKRLMTDATARHHLVKKGKIQVKKYSWQHMAEETRALYDYELRQLQKPHYHG